MQLDGLRRTWRTFGYWGLALNTTGIPPYLIVIDYYNFSVNTTPIIEIYPLIIGGFIAAAGVRQWGKSKSVTE